MEGEQNKKISSNSLRASRLFMTFNDKINKLLQQKLHHPHIRACCWLKSDYNGMFPRGRPDPGEQRSPGRWLQDGNRLPTCMKNRRTLTEKDKDAKRKTLQIFIGTVIYCFLQKREALLFSKLLDWDRLKSNKMWCGVWLDFSLSLLKSLSSLTLAGSEYRFKK